jgi:hypothetical protein
VTFTVGQLVKALTLMAALVVVAVVAIPNLTLQGARSGTPAAVRTVTVTNAGPTAEAGDTRQAAYDKCLPLQAEFRANPAKFGIISVGQPNSAQINFDYLTAAWANEAGVNGNDVVLRMACNSALRGVPLP